MIDDLQTIPGIGPKMSEALRALGYGCAEELRGQDPQQMYDDLCRRRGRPIDRCVLYVFRCAVYYAGHPKHSPRLLKWWNWKDD